MGGELNKVSTTASKDTARRSALAQPTIIRKSTNSILRRLKYLSLFV